MSCDSFQNIERKFQGCSPVLTGNGRRTAAANSMKERLQLQLERLAGRDLELTHCKFRSGMVQFSRKRLRRLWWPWNCV